MTHDPATIERVREGLPTVHDTEVDGVQTFWVDVGPPFVATLMFRVGMADESLATRGITHLVEHLALSPLRAATHPFNGSVEMDATTFWAAGSVEDVGAFMTRLVGNLATLPLERLDLEAGVLIAEGASRPSSTHASILAQRFGPHGPGLILYPEFGLRRVTGEAVQHWAEEWFTADNAVLVLTGPPPGSLRLPLLRGRRRHLGLPADNYSFEMTGPTRVGTQSAGVAVGTFGQRSIALVMAGRIVALRAQERLRHELGRVYAVAHDYMRLTSDEAYVYWGADSSPEHAAEVAVAFASVLTELATAGPTDAEVERLITMAEQVLVMDRASVAHEMAVRSAGDALRGYQPYSFTEVLTEMRTATPEELEEALAHVMRRAMAISTNDADIGFAEALWSRDMPVRGRSARTKRDGVATRFVLGEDSLAMSMEGSWLTLRFDEIEIVEHQDDGGRLLIDRRGSWISVAPETRRLRRLIAGIDERAAPDLIVPVGRSGRPV